MEDSFIVISNYYYYIGTQYKEIENNLCTITLPTKYFAVNNS